MSPHGRTIVYVSCADDKHIAVLGFDPDTGSLNPMGIVKVPGTEHMLYHPGTCFTTKSLNRLRPSSARLCKRVSPPRGKTLRGPRNRTVLLLKIKR